MVTYIHLRCSRFMLSLVVYLQPTFIITEGAPPDILKKTLQAYLVVSTSVFFFYTALLVALVVHIRFVKCLTVKAVSDDQRKSTLALCTASLWTYIYQCTKQPHISLYCHFWQKLSRHGWCIYFFFVDSTYFWTKHLLYGYIIQLYSDSSLLYFQWCKECKSLIDEGEPIRKSVSCYYYLLVACWTLLFLNYSVYSIWITSNTIYWWWNWCDLASWKITESLTSVTYNLLGRS